LLQRSPANLFFQKFDSFTTSKPRLFYWEEAYDAWIPAPERIEHIIDTESHFGEHGETFEITFKRVDMTDDEFDKMFED
jgi:hypothetical protein